MSMLRKKIKIATCAAATALCACLIGPAPALADDSQHIQQTMHVMNVVVPSFNTENFATLEQWAEEYRSKKTRLPGGEWLIDTFYEAFNYTLAGPDTDAVLNRCRNTIEKWKKAYPESPTPYIAHATLMFQYAWKKRGTKWANEVWKDELKKFHDALEEARNVLETNKAIASKDPYWYSLLVEIYNGLNVDPKSLLELAKEGTAREPGYFRTYYSVMSYLDPRWHGDVKKVEDWIKIASEQTRETDGHSMYARMYIHLLDTYWKELFHTFTADVPRLRSSVADLLKRYPSVGNYEVAIRIACSTHDEAWAREQYAISAKTFGPKYPQNIEPENVLCGWVVADAARPKDPGVLPPPTPVPGLQVQKAAAVPAPNAENLRLATALLETQYLSENAGKWRTMLQMSASSPASQVPGDAQMKEKMTSSWRHAVEAGFDTKKFADDIRNSVASAMSIEELKQALAFQETPLGRKLTELEKPTGTDAKDVAIMQAKSDAAMKAIEADPARKALLKKIVEACGGAGVMVDAMQNFSLAVGLGSAAAMPQGAPRPSTEDIKSAVAASRFQLLRVYEPMIFNQFAMIYGTLTNAELDDYLKQLTSPSGKGYIAAHLAGFKQTMHAQGLAIGALFAREITGQRI